MSMITKSLTAIIGLSICGVSGYLLYLLFRKEDEDDLIDVYAQAAKFKTLEIRIPKDMVRVLIGRNGKNIHLIQEQSNTRISFRDADGGEDKICVIRGSFEACNMADNLILDIISNQPVIESEDMWVPATRLKVIIGSHGTKIAEIRGTSGASIIVNDDEQGLTRKRLTLKGTREQVNLARYMIEGIIEEAEDMWTKLEACSAVRRPRSRSTTPDCIRNVEKPAVESISPHPGQPDASIEVYMSAMVDPSRFWLQIVGPKAIQLDHLVDKMTEYYNTYKEAHTLEHIEKGDMVAAIFQYDNQWYRAEVLDIIETDSGKEAELFYVDYGDVDRMPVESLYELKVAFLSLHFQAIECYLERVEPVGDGWSKEAVDKFEELTHVAQWKKLSAKVNGYSVRERTRAKREGSPVPGVHLYEINSDYDVDIAEELVKAGLAVFKSGADVPTSSRTTSISNLSIASSS